MAELTKPNPNSSGVATTVPGPEHRLGGLIAGEAIDSTDIVYIKNSDGKVYKASGAAANEAARARGFAPFSAPAGEAVSVYRDIRVYYPTSGLRGQDVFLSGTVAGGLADTASTGGSTPIGYVIDNERIHLFP